MQTSKTAVAQLMRVAWRTVGWICEPSSTLLGLKFIPRLRDAGRELRLHRLGAPTGLPVHQVLRARPPARSPARQAVDMGTRQECRAARALVAGYHEARLAELLDHVADALGRYRAGAASSSSRARSSR